MSDLLVPLREDIHTKAAASLSVTLRVSTALRTICLLMTSTCLLVFVLAVSAKQQTAWPLMNISQYAATYPAIYFFRIGTSVSAVLLLGCTSSFYHHRTPLQLGPFTLLVWIIAGVGLGASGLISCTENNGVHTSFALSMFVANTMIQSGRSLCWKEETEKPWTRYSSLLVAGAVYLWMCLIVTALMATKVLPKVGYVVSLLEWTGTCEIMVWMWWYAADTDRTIARVEANRVGHAAIQNVGSEQGFAL